MKASRFSDAQKAFILKQGADGVPVADIGETRLACSTKPSKGRPSGIRLPGHFSVAINRSMALAAMPP